MTRHLRSRGDRDTHHAALQATVAVPKRLYTIPMTQFSTQVEHEVTDEAFAAGQNDAGLTARAGGKAPFLAGPHVIKIDLRDDGRVRGYHRVPAIRISVLGQRNKRVTGAIVYPDDVGNESRARYF